MSPRRRARDRAEAEPSANTPAQQDEADIVQEVGAETDPETGALLTDEEKIREIGALDAESVRDNRRHDDMVGKKRANVKNVTFNISDVLVQYDQLTRVWPPNSLYISVKRLTGTAIQQTITSCPRNGQELYAAMQQVHGQNAEASYELGFLDATTKQYRGKGNITMPDTRGPFAQGQPPMNPQNPYGYPPYPTQPLPGYSAPAPQAAVPPSGYAAPPPAIPSYAAMAGMDINAFLALQKQQFEFWQAAKSGHAGAPAANPLPHPGSAPSPPDHAAFTAFLQAQFELWQQQARTGGGAPAQAPSGMVLVPGVGLVPTERILHALAAPPATVSAPQPAPQNPQGAMPPVQPPPGMVFVPGWGMVTMEALAQAQAQTAGVPRPASSMAYRPAYGPRPAYYAGGGGDSAPPGPTPYAAPQQPKTPAEQFREAVSIVETAVSIADRFRPPAQAQAEPEPAVDDDNPIRIIEAGTAKVLVNRADGKLRAWETGWANLDKIFNFVKEQAEAYRKAQPSGGGQQQQQQKPQLPPGYVEVTPGYVPPAGYVVGPPVAVPAAPQAPEQQQLPDPPAQMPAPMQPAEEPPRRRSWGMPPTSGGS